MLTSNLAQLEALVEVVTGIGAIIGVVGGFALRGWVAAAKAERDALEKEVSDLSKLVKEHSENDKKAFDTQWQRIDEMRDKTARKEELDGIASKVQNLRETYVDRAYHEQSLTRVTEILKEPISAINNAIEALRVEVKNLAVQVAASGHRGE